MSIESPCLKICVMDATSELCRGCGRTLSEIGAWSSIADSERRSIMAELPDRMRAARLPDVVVPATSST
jgi:predicted Fe-S protein YdhL (DUF1289 family)